VEKHESNRGRRYRCGSPALENRKRGPNVWVYFYTNWIDGKSHRRKVVLGAVKELTSVQAQLACEPLRQAAKQPDSGAAIG
jgi:hypothetical protein